MKRLKEIRKEKGISQKKIAEMLDTSNKNIWAYENGNASPSVDMIVKIADVLDVSIDYLLGRSDDLENIGGNSSIFSTEEQKLMMKYRTLDSKKQNAVKVLLDVL